MIHRSSRRTIRRRSCVMPLLWIVILLCMARITFAAVVGDQVELKATYQPGVPLHKEPRGTDDFQRVPDGTKATVIEVAQDGRWVKPSLPEGRTGWVTSRYVSSASARAPSTGTSPSRKKPQRIEEGIVERVDDGDTITVLTANQPARRSERKIGPQDTVELAHEGSRALRATDSAA